MSKSCLQSSATRCSRMVRRRLNSRLVGNDRGAVAVVFALLMVVLLGFTALTIDIARMQVQKVQLQNGADAGALAIAADCANAGASACSGTAAARADYFANSNNNTGLADASHSFPAAGTVVVNTAAMDGDGLGMPMYFAPIRLINRANVRAQATVTWGGPLQGDGAVPLAFAECQFTLTEEVQVLQSKGEGPDESCVSSNASGQVLPGGFEWLDPETGGNGCFANVTALTFEESNTGAEIMRTAALVSRSNAAGS